jgi:hypothetical protein
VVAEVLLLLGRQVDQVAQAMVEMARLRLKAEQQLLMPEAVRAVQQRQTTARELLERVAAAQLPQQPASRELLI